jgi:kynurenine formamidase
LEQYYQVMHLELFPAGLVHAENLGGQIEEVSNQRLWIGCFPLRGIELESSMCRIIGLLPPA